MCAGGVEEVYGKELLGIKLLNSLKIACRYS